MTSTARIPGTELTGIKGGLLKAAVRRRSARCRTTSR